jgi:hypothetical protein
LALELEPASVTVGLEGAGRCLLDSLVPTGLRPLGLFKVLSPTTAHPGPDWGGRSRVTHGGAKVS